MYIEVAHYCLVLAFVVAIFSSVLPLWGSFYQNSALIRFARPAVLTQFFLIVVSFAGLAYAFLTDDFSVSYVASHSFSLLPAGYKFSAIWGAHEGSMLLWILVLTGWSAAVALFSKQLPQQAVARVLAVMSIISVGFMAFSIFTSNPFERLLPNFPVDGRDLNPLLQDFGFLIHPPLLYMGYVGFSVAFAFAVAALISGELDSAWARWSRPWTTAAWIFLTLGIMLGSWWAYYELGWGGWWFWDPVENASFMPWLSGTALIHTLAACEKRGVFKTWTVFLALMTFCLSLFGTFIVRSGVITSVHSFAQDPVRGLFILLFLGIVVVASLTLFVFRSSAVVSTGKFKLRSRETLLIGNNLLLMGGLFVVFIGTIFPLVMEAFNRSVSVGEPFFNALFPVFMVPLFVLVGIGHWMHWKNHPVEKMKRAIKWIFSLLVVLLLVANWWFWSFATVGVWIGLVVSLWIVSSIVFDIVDKTRNSRSFVAGLRKLRISYWGMHLAHTGIVVMVMGIVLVSSNSQDKLIRLTEGEVYDTGRITVMFNGVEPVEGPNYMATRGEFKVTEGERQYTIFSDKRRYMASGQVMTEAGIDPGFTRDVYISLGEPLEGNSWSVRLYVKSFVRWIWLGAILMALGGVLAILDKRYRVSIKSKPVAA